MENDVDKFDRQFRSFLDATVDARRLSEIDRDYADLKQWTEEEVATLRARGQAPVVFDYIAEQVDYFLGMERDTRMDPRAFPRTQEHEQAADAATAALGYVHDDADFEQTSSQDFEDLLVQGTEAAIVEPVPDGDDYRIAIRHIPWDRFYYDPHSRRRDFDDAEYMGIVVWMDQEEAKRMFGGKAKDIESRLNGHEFADGGTFDDRPLWIDTKRKRLRVCQHYYKHNGEWHTCYFSGDLMLTDPKPSPLLDENGDPDNPIVAASAYVDRNNNRFGYVRRLIDPQNEVNHRRSKALFLLSSQQVLAEEGVVTDQHAAKQELKKPDGWVTLTPGSLREGAIQINPTADYQAGQLNLYQDAVNKLDKSGANAAMQGDVEGMSGRAIQRLQHGGNIQVGPLFDIHRAWKRRIYRQVWNRIRQFWDAPKWVRVTDDENNLKWVGLNQPVTVGEELQKRAQQGDQMAAQMLEQLVATQDPRLTQVVKTENNIAELDVDIILDEAPDTVTTQEDQFKMLAELVKVYGPQAVPFRAMIELSSIRNKQRVLDLIEGDDEQKAMMAQQQQMQEQLNQLIQQLEMQGMELDNAKKAAETQTEQAKAAKTAAEATQTEIENAIAQAFPDVKPNVNI